LALLVGRRRRLPLAKRLDAADTSKSGSITTASTATGSALKAIRLNRRKHALVEKIRACNRNSDLKPGFDRDAA
jgi:hypothetical protein